MIQQDDLDLVEMLAAKLSKDAANKPAGDLLVAGAIARVAKAIRAYQSVTPAEERAAFDLYYSGAMRDGRGALLALEEAKKMLANRRELFGGGGGR